MRARNSYLLAGLSGVLLLRVYRYNEYSLYREFSPLSEENAGDSQVIADNNVIYSAQKDYDVDESCQFTLVE